MIGFRQKGDFSNTEKLLKKSLGSDFESILNRYGRQGVDALSAATPVHSGKTASMWSYEIEKGQNVMSIVWTNANVQNGVNIALILQYGHGTRNGGYVQGIDYINPALRPIFEDLANAAWREVTAK